MIPELGNFALILAFCFALLQGTLPLCGAVRYYQPGLRLVTPIVIGQASFLLLSYSCLTYAFISNDFSLAYVAENSHSQLPLGYRLAGVWGAHEGSLLLWATILGAWTLGVCFFSKSLPETIRALVLAVLGWVSFGFLLFLLATSNPFTRLLPEFPAEGHDLNPLLQDPGMAIHPPMLYMGYVGFSVAFAFAIAALINGRLDAAWARWTRPWTLVAWSFLTFGITLGSGWAYRVLGWGGWWFWDPVENASFLPWLTGTALIHSLIVVEKRNAFKSWTALLAICAFSLSLIGTFLVRSGILTSVHAFASDPTRGAFMLGFLAVVIGGSLFLFAWRATAIRGEGYFQLLSRETLLLSNNVLLVVMMVTILLGTLYPLLLDATGMGKISVGAPYFNAVFIPLMSFLLLLMGIGPLCRWRKTTANLLWLRLRFILIVALTAGILLPLIFAATITIHVVLGFSLACWVVLATYRDMRDRASLQKLSRRQYGMMLAHLGIAVCVIGITLTSAYQIERDVKMSMGDSVMVGSYNFQFADLHDQAGPNYQSKNGIFQISQGGHVIASLVAEKRLYHASNMPITKAAIEPGVWRDLYIALGEPLPDGAWSVRIYYKPFVRWIWYGGIMMMCGGLIAASARTKFLLNGKG